LYTHKKENTWQVHQSEFVLKRQKKRLIQKYVRLSMMLVIPSLLILGAWHFLDLEPLFKQKSKQIISKPGPAKEQDPPEFTLSKTDLKGLIQKTVFLNVDKDVFFVDTPDKSYTLTTSLDTRLQKTLAAAMARLKTLNRGKPQRIAIVAMDPSNGSLKAMAGFDLGNLDANPCMVSDYPAASIFKIITASAAIDSLGYTAHTPLYFNGNKYTLYKRQLAETRNKYTSKTSLSRAFAESINPIFGKIGKNYLGRTRLSTYAHSFGFNQEPDSELAFESGRFSVTESDYHLAELGCGFNRDTMISPIFGAMLMTTILNSGTSLVPRIVNQVKTSNGQIIYKGKKEYYKTAITPKTADTMIRLMQTTVTRGTAKKSFRGFSRDKVLSKLVIGGKTGSLYNRKRTVKYDWFIGFGKEKTGGKALAVAIVVGHKKYIGTRASTYARKILKTYFKEIPVRTAQLNKADKD
jgi:cell division protein FtsI/penicillin-binding protein 2